MTKNSLIFTNDMCVGCNKCIKYCPGLGVNRAIDEGETSRIVVDGLKCIHCGECLKVCEHDARSFADDFMETLEGLSHGEKIVLMIAPSFFLTYPDESSYIIGYLRSLGFMAIYDVSVGANITTWACVKYIKNTGRTGLISSACPVVVDYIEKYKPSLISRLMPIMSPVGCLRTYLASKVYADSQDDIKYAFLGPCIGKHDEYTSYPDGQKLDYTFTYKSIISYFDNHKDLLKQSGRSECDPLRSSGLGRFYPVPGGLMSNLRNYLGYDSFIKQIEGPSKAYPYLSTFEKMMKTGDALPLVIDILNCEGGCNEGVATDTSVEEAEILMTRIHKNSLLLADTSASSPFDAAMSPSDRFAKMDSILCDDEGLDYHDFTRTYNEDAAISEKKVRDKDIEAVFLRMGKITLADRKVNCTSCGYHSCREMAEAICRGYNEPENCVHHVKNALMSNTRQLEQLLESISGGKENVGLSIVKSDELVQAIQNAIIEVEAQREDLNNTVQARTQMFANLTHELRTPLNAIMNMAELLDKTNLNEEQLNNINSISTAGNSLMDTINEILDFSKLEAGKFNIVEDDYKLHELLSEVTTVTSFRCADKKLQYIKRLDPTTPNELIGDYKRIRQVLVNISGNAVKYTNFGSVTVECGWNHDKDNPVLIFNITDTGIGIKDEDIPFLFDSYRQVNETESKHIIGTGLGLSISKNITDSMGGTLSVESTYGVGSKFTLTLPQKMTQYVAISDFIHKDNKDTEVSKGPTPFSVPSLKVLVVDDVNINLHIARTYLDQLQIYVDSASSGTEALQKCSQRKYDLIFMDYLMPDMNGLKVAETIKDSDNLNRDTLVVCMSAMGEQSTDEAFKIIFDGYLEKPLKREMLLELIASLIDKDKLVYDIEGTIPSREAMLSASKSQDIESLLLYYASLERFAKSRKQDALFRLVKKYRIMIQQGHKDGPIEGANAVLDMLGQ